MDVRSFIFNDLREWHGESYSTGMKTNALFKFGQITILTAILATSNLLFTGASSFDPGSANRAGTSFTKDTRRGLKIPDQRHTSDAVQFNTIDGEPLN